jgi:arylsulfatase A-like enzyme
MQTVGGTIGKGSHASLSRYDMNNTLVAHGPSFKRGFIDDMPTGNIDVAPTILWLLGVQPPAIMDGRVLHEALANTSVKPPRAQTKKLETERNIGLFRWSQYLKFSTVGSTRYYDEGNGQVLRR